MKKIDYKIIITILSFIIIIVTKSDIDLSNLKSNYISIPIFKEIFYYLSVGIFSAMVLILTIDEISERNKKREEQRRTQIFYLKLIPIIKDYYDFYVKLYIATKSEKVL